MNEEEIQQVQVEQMRQQQALQQQQYIKQQDMMENYGSVIKDLTDTRILIEDFKNRIMGLKEVNGELIRYKEVDIDPNAFDEFISLIEGIVNQNTHFSRYDNKTVNNILYAANYHINRYLMHQGDRIPLRYRANIATEAMCLITASLHKAKDGNILVWTKGTFAEQRNMGDSSYRKRGVMDWIIGKR